MASTERISHPEREQTDESLRAERERVDETLAERVAAVDEAADAVIEKARARADQLLAAARARTDRKTAGGAGARQTPAMLATERATEDRTVCAERADADETLRVERAAVAATLADDRGETDKDLSDERARSDDVVATRDDFMAVVSHDLRNMLGAMVGFAALIEREASHENRAAEILVSAQRIHRSGARMARLIGDLVDVACIDAGTLAVTPEPADAARIVAEAVDTFQGHASAKGVSLESDIVSRLGDASFDPARILQVLVNLVSNAIKFTPPKGKVVVRVERLANELRFAVTDTGIGIPADKLKAVFERFLQIAKDDRRGVGLGLYISKSIVQGHGGRIWAESVIGKGTKVSFTLPLAAAA